MGRNDDILHLLRGCWELLVCSEFVCHRISWDTFLLTHRIDCLCYIRNVDLKP